MLMAIGFQLNEQSVMVMDTRSFPSPCCYCRHSLIWVWACMVELFFVRIEFSKHKYLDMYLSFENGEKFMDE